MFSQEQSFCNHGQGEFQTLLCENQLLKIDIIPGGCQVQLQRHDPRPRQERQSSPIPPGTVRRQHQRGFLDRFTGPDLRQHASCHQGTGRRLRTERSTQL